MANRNNGYLNEKINIKVDDLEAMKGLLI